ncbi:MAG TPA: amidohydrolase family protein, partial [Gaiellaceae bacterium]|nr:amidohydrolase family protein [Gaiellaceae bacterium]
MTVLSADWVVPVEGPPIRDGAVDIDDNTGLIAAVGPRADLGDSVHYEEAVILPGFVNAHTHLEYAVYAGFGDGLGFADWIGLHVQRKQQIDLEDMEAIARLGALNCLRSGVTTVGDCSFSGAAATACADLGLRGTIYLEVFGATADPIREHFEPMRARISETLSDDVRVGVSPHAPYTCTIELYEACADLGLPVATHLAESDAETEFLRTGTGAWESFAEMLVTPPGTTGIRALAGAGLLDSNVIAAHCVKADEEEIALLAEHDVAVAHCPRSNGVLGCGVAPLTQLREAGIRVCIATDSPASTPSFDMFDELRTAIVSARARDGRPEALTAADALELATLGGARALRLGDSVGSLVPGKKADLTVLSLADTSFIPWEDPVTGAVLGGTPHGVIATLVSGKPRYEKGGKTWLE